MSELSSNMVKDITGKKFGNLTALKQLGVRKQRAVWLFACSCGKQVPRRANYAKTVLSLGYRPSCGCSKKLDPTSLLSGAEEKRHLIWSVKCNPCTDCRQWFKPWQMQFDHLPQWKKDRRLNFGGALKYSRFINEIRKCQLVCSNCHLNRTYERLYS